MNCAGDTRGMLNAIMKMEKAAILCPRLAEHIGYLIAIIHRDHHATRDWRECGVDSCRHTQSLMKLACEEVLHDDIPNQKGETT